MVVTRTTRNRFVLNRARGFESHHLRQKSQIQTNLRLFVLSKQLDQMYRATFQRQALRQFLQELDLGDRNRVNCKATSKQEIPAVRKGSLEANAFKELFCLRRMTGCKLDAF